MRIKKRFTLKNGLPVVVADLGSTEAVTVLLLTHTGSRQETGPEAGLSHFLEHMVFKGTKTWPTAQALTHFIDSLGADFNAYTGKEVTGYYIKAAAEHLPKILKLLSEMVWASVLDENEMTREKEVIVQEINMYEDNPLMFVDDLLERVMFEKSNLGKTISGTRESVRALSKTQVVKYLKKFYHPTNMLLVVAGKTEGGWEKEVRKNFELKIEVGVLPKFSAVTVARNQLILKYKETEQAQLALGVPALPLRHKDETVLELISVILGGNMSSRLFSRLREREGLCYFIKSQTMAYEKVGALVIQAGLDKDKIDKALQLIKEELKSLVQVRVPEAELNKAKQYLRGKILLGIEDSAGVADWLGKQIMMEKRLRLPNQLIAEINKVKASDILRVARAIIKPECYNLAVIGPYKDKLKIIKGLKK